MASPCCAPCTKGNMVSSATWVGASSARIYSRLRVTRNTRSGNRPRRSRQHVPVNRIGSATAPLAKPDRALGRNRHLRHVVRNLSHLRPRGLPLPERRAQARTPPADQLPRRERQDHRLLCAQRGRNGHARRSSGLAGTAILLARIGGDEQRAQLAASARARRLMKRYAPWLLVAFVLALLLNLGLCADRTRIFLDSPIGRASYLDI